MREMTPAKFEILLPLACAWAEGQEGLILQTGVELTKSQLEDATKVGVAEPKRVRLLKVEQMPMPADAVLRRAARVFRLSASNMIGRTLRYGIFIRADMWGLRNLVVHELVHTMQYERLGGFAGFLRPYLWECLFPPGYPYGPLEQEANETETRLCAKPLSSY